MKISLIWMDIDGTLVNDSHIVPKETATALRQASKKGIRLALVSGRYPKGIRLTESQIGVGCMKAAYAGGYIFDEKGCLYSEYLSTERAFQIYDIAREEKGDCWFFSEEDWYVTQLNPWVETECINVSSRPDVVTIDKLDGIFKKKNSSPSKVLVTGEPETVGRIYKRLLSMKLNLGLALSSPVYLEIMPLGIDKGFALEKLCEFSGIPLEETLSFGDQELDIPLVEKAGIGIAVENGSEEIKKKADYITKSNNDSGIAYALKEILGII